MASVPDLRVVEARRLTPTMLTMRSIMKMTTIRIAVVTTSPWDGLRSVVRSGLRLRSVVPAGAAGPRTPGG
jgi:hypothetical protein